MALFFFFNDTATTEIYTLSLHDALPISEVKPRHEERLQILFRLDLAAEVVVDVLDAAGHGVRLVQPVAAANRLRSEEHTSELQSRLHLVCRLLLEKKKNSHITVPHPSSL